MLIFILRVWLRKLNIVKEPQAFYEDSKPQNQPFKIQTLKLSIFLRNVNKTMKDFLQVYAVHQGTVFFGNYCGSAPSSLKYKNA